jgi:YbbR domain-containing protein
LNNQSTPTAEVNLSNITATGFTPISYDIIYPSDIDSSISNDDQQNVPRISLIVDRMSRVPVPVKVDYKGGTASDDLIADAAIFDPQTVIVSGPEEVISKIDYANVPITRVNLSSTFNADLEFVLYDETGEELTETQLKAITLNTKLIRVTVPIRQMKDVPLSVALVHGAGSTELHTNVICEPRFITVAGDPDAIRDFNSITLTTIDTTRMSKLKTTETYQIIIPNYLTNKSGETEASVTVELLGLDIGYYSTPNLEVSNTPAGLSAVILNQSVLVLIRGKKEDLELITDNMSIRVVADLADRELGLHQVPAKVYVDGIDADIGAVGNYMITVRLIKETT